MRFFVILGINYRDFFVRLIEKSQNSRYHRDRDRDREVRKNVGISYTACGFCSSGCGLRSGFALVYGSGLGLRFKTFGLKKLRFQNLG